jgi:hypothetical protein
MNAERKEKKVRLSIGLNEWDLSLFKEARLRMFPKALLDESRASDLNKILHLAAIAFVRGVLLQARPETDSRHWADWMVPMVAVLRKETDEEMNARVEQRPWPDYSPTPANEKSTQQQSGSHMVCFTITAVEKKALESYSRFALDKSDPSVLAGAVLRVCLAHPRTVLAMFNAFFRYYAAEGFSGHRRCDEVMLSRIAQCREYRR